MYLSQSVVLWHGRVGIQKIALFGKTPSSYYGKNKQREKTVQDSLRHEAQSKRKCQEHWTFLQVQSQKPSSPKMKLALMKTATGKEDPELPLLQRTLFIRVTSLRNQYLTDPQIAPHRVQVTDISTSTVQRRLRESGLHGQIAAKKPLKDTNKKKILAWAKKHEQWTLDQWKCVLWSDESKLDLKWFNLI